MKQRTAAINQIRGLLAKFGIVVPQGRRTLMAALPDILEDAENQIPPMMRGADVYLGSAIGWARYSDSRLNTNSGIERITHMIGRQKPGV